MNILVVYDELDAHVGGEAAVAIAKLLKRQGKYRQIISVTHNPVLAAAADVHYVVSKPMSAAVVTTGTTSTMKMVSSSTSIKQCDDESESHSSTPTCTDDVGSFINEATGEARELELARMVTGTMEASKSLELARQLLSYDFSI